MRNAVAVMLSLAALATCAQHPWTPATEGWVSQKVAQAEARTASNTAAQVSAVLTNGVFSGATLAGETVLTGGVVRVYGGLESLVESGLAVYGASPDSNGVRGSSGTGGYGVYGTTYSGWAGVAGFGMLAPGIYGSGGVGYPGGWFVGDTGASPAGVATGLIAEAGLDRTQPGLYTPNSVHAYAFYGSGASLTGITERTMAAGTSNVIVSAITTTGRQDIAAGAMFSTPGYAGAAGGVDGWALYPDSYQGLSQGAAWTLGAGAMEWRDETKQARADTWGLWMRDIETDLYLSLSGDFLKAREGSKYSHWTGFHRRKTTGISVYTNAATEDVIVAMNNHKADEDAHFGIYAPVSAVDAKLDRDGGTITNAVLSGTVTIGGVTRTSWPEGGTGAAGSDTNTFCNAPFCASVFLAAVYQNGANVIANGASNGTANIVWESRTPGFKVVEIAYTYSSAAANVDLSLIYYAQPTSGTNQLVATKTLVAQTAGCFSVVIPQYSGTTNSSCAAVLLQVSGTRGTATFWTLAAYRARWRNATADESASYQVVQ